MTIARMYAVLTGLSLADAALLHRHGLAGPWLYIATCSAALALLAEHRGRPCSSR